MEADEERKIKKNVKQEGNLKKVEVEDENMMEVILYEYRLIYQNLIKI